MFAVTLKKLLLPVKCMNLMLIFWALKERKRFISVSPASEQEYGRMAAAEVFSMFGSAILPSRHPFSIRVRRVAERLLDAAEDAGVLLNAESWKVYVVEATTPNAFVLPSGEIFVFSGIFSVARTDDELAAVIGHEIAHRIARHAAESISMWRIVQAALFVLAALWGSDVGDATRRILADLLLMRPFSRAHEREADAVGLRLMAHACFQPAAAVAFWSRMAQAIPQAATSRWTAFVSTHPSNAQRIAALAADVPAAVRIRNESRC